MAPFRQSGGNVIPDKMACAKDLRLFLISTHSWTIRVRFMRFRPKVAVLFDNLGPYHRSRLRTANEHIDVLAIEFGASSGDYAWWRESASPGFSHTCLNPTGLGDQHNRTVFLNLLWSSLDGFSPDVVAAPGWSSRGSLMAIGWASKRGAPTILMSESTAHDEVRVKWKEWIKRRLVGCFSAALAGGSAHAAYLRQLGMRGDRIFLGYDAVDNDHFAPSSSTSRSVNSREASNLRDTSDVSSSDSAVRVVSNPNFIAAPFFLASARFVAKKNLPSLLLAFARYRERSAEIGRTPWNLVLLGDGPLRPELERLVDELGLRTPVRDGGSCEFPGFVQYEQLPAFYHAATAFIHISTTEQWGLVVNEAMAAGLPVLVSKRCGCAPDLVKDGVNGWTLYPYDPEAIAHDMLKMATLSEVERQAMGRASRQIIADWGPQRFAQGMSDAAACALQHGPRHPSLMDRLLLRLLTLR